MVIYCKIINNKNVTEMKPNYAFIPNRITRKPYSNIIFGNSLCS